MSHLLLNLRHVPEDEADVAATPTLTTRFTAALPVQAIIFVCVIATIWIGLYPQSLINWANTGSRYLLALAM